jgi:hypothetical protein
MHLQAKFIAAQSKALSLFILRRVDLNADFL